MNSEVIRLSLPAKAEYLVTARLVVGAVFGQAGYDMDEIEDAKTATSEACLLLMPAGDAAAELHLEMWVEGGVHTVISTEGRAGESEDTPEREFGMFLLEALIDKVEFEQTGAKREYRLFKAMPA